MRKILNSILLILLSTFSFSVSSKDIKTEKVIQVQEEYPIVILGGGVGALTSGIYLARAGNTPIIVEGDLPGGMITQSHSVENWPGEIKISGFELMDKMKDQAEKNGCVFFEKTVIDVDFSKKPFKITLKDLYDDSIEEIKAQSCIIAMGTSSNYLNVPGEQKYWGRGVSNCAVCDGSLYKDKVVAIIGGSDAAVTEAHYLKNIASKVYIIARKNKIRSAEKQRLDELLNDKKITVLYNSVVSEIHGNKDNVTDLVIKNLEKNNQYKLDVNGVFLAIGSTPNTKMFKNKLKLDKKGYISVTDDQQTSVEGVYAIGDIVDPVYKQAITAAADGAKAAINSSEYLVKFNKSNFQKIDKMGFGNVDSIIEITSLSQFQKEIKNSKVPVLVDFYATWCRPCKRLAPMLASKAKTMSGKVKVLKVNVEKLRVLSQRYKISAMPTLIIVDGNENLIFKTMGPTNIVELLNNLEGKSSSEIDSYLKDLNK